MVETGEGILIGLFMWGGRPAKKFNCVLWTKLLRFGVEVIMRNKNVLQNGIAYPKRDSRSKCQATSSTTAVWPVKMVLASTTWKKSEQSLRIRKIWHNFKNYSVIPNTERSDNGLRKLSKDKEIDKIVWISGAIHNLNHFWSKTVSFWMFWVQKVWTLDTI